MDDEHLRLPVAAEQLAQLRADVEAHLRGSWRRFHRGSSAGPTGDRFEHWASLSATELQGEATAQVLHSADWSLETCLMAGKFPGL